MKVSSSSSVVSCTNKVPHCPVVEPAWIVVGHTSAERSAAAAVSPVPNDAVQVTVTAAEAAADSVSGKEMTAPSVAEAFPMLSVGRAAAARVTCTV